MSTVLGYKPSLALAVVGAIVFGVAAAYHLFLFVRSRTYSFWWMIVAILMEAAAFGTRAYSATHPDNTRKFLTSYLLLILSPSIVGVALISLFDRIVWYVTPPFHRKFTTTWVPSGITLKLYHLVYVASILIEIAGAGGLVGSFASPTSTEPTAPDAYHAGEAMLRVACIMQAGCLGLFALVGLHFVFVARKWQPSTVITTEVPNQSWKKLTWAVILATVLLVLRTVYRVFEFSSTSSTIKDFFHTHEFMFYACDATPMMAVFVLLGLTHPSFCLPPHYTKFWFSKSKIQKAEKMILEQNWPTFAHQRAGSTDEADVEYATVVPEKQDHSRSSSSSSPYQPPSWPKLAHLPSRN